MTRITRAFAHTHNPALFRAGLPTFGGAATVEAYLAALPRKDRARARTALLIAEPKKAAPARAPKRAQVQPTAAEIAKYGYVRALIRANKAA